MGNNINCKRCGKALEYGEGVNGICDECLTKPWSGSNKKEIKLTKEEDILKLIAIIILISGVILSIVLAFNLIMIEEGSSYYSYKKFSPTGLGITIATFLFSISSWAILSCFAEISANIRKIANKDDKQL